MKQGINSRRSIPLFVILTRFFGTDAINVPKTRRCPQEEENDKKERARAGKTIYSQSDGGTNYHCRHKLTQYAKGKAHHIA
jgi:hypothetical protein